jgi:ferric-dicitrate binding protein FerR (iron transport regulator)
MPASKPTRPLDWARESGTVEAVLENMSAKLKKRRQRRIKSGTRIGSLVLLLAFGVWLVPFLRQTDSLQTNPAQRQAVTLADGSGAELNAFFSVVSDPEHPFVVKTPAGAVRVTGTKFNVRLNAEGGGTLTLVEGAVTVRQDEAGNSMPDIAVRPNEQVCCVLFQCRRAVFSY